jgi:hypothetical protein
MSVHGPKDWHVHPECSVIVQEFGVQVSPGALTLVFERRPEGGDKIPSVFAVLFPPSLARLMLAALREEEGRDDRPEWLKSH